MTLGARSAYLAGRWLANMSGGSTTWSSTDTRIRSSVRIGSPPWLRCAPPRYPSNLTPVSAEVQRAPRRTLEPPGRRGPARSESHGRVEVVSEETRTRVRRAAAPFLPVTVVRSEALTPRMVRVTLGGPELAAFERPQPAASIRLLVPESPDHELVLPAWAGNEWLLPDGRRAKEWIRTYTPGAFRPDAGRPPELDVDVVLHDGGVTSDWA